MRKVDSAADPANEGDETDAPFRIEGDVLVIEGEISEIRYRRVRSGSN
jgi:hypothetical protein